MSAHEVSKYRAALRGLLKIAEMAMPVTFYDSDARVRAAKKLLGIQPIRCERCGVQFVRRRSEARFCTKKCQLKAWREK